MTKAPVSKAHAGNRIAKVLARAGIASRRDAEKIIAEGRVRVNGKVVDSPALNITDADRVSVDGKLVADPEPPRLWLYHKPAGLVTTEKDEQGRTTVFESLPADLPRVMSIGRLDITSEGLLVLTNDGAVKRRLELPSTGWLRRYRVRINGSVSEDRLDQLRKGITVDGITYAAMGVQFDRQQGANAWLTCTLKEGKNREIRRTMEAIGVVVNRLIRISYGPFQLGNLAPGEVEELKPRVVRDQLGLDTRPQPARKRKGAEATDSGAPTPSATATRAVKGKTAARRPGAKPAYGKAVAMAEGSTRHTTAPLDPAAAKPPRKARPDPETPRAQAQRDKPTRVPRDKPTRAQGSLSHDRKPKSDAPATAETKRFRAAQAALPDGPAPQTKRLRPPADPGPADGPKLRKFTARSATPEPGRAEPGRAAGFRSHAPRRKPGADGNQGDAAPDRQAGKPQRFGKSGGYKSHKARTPPAAETGDATARPPSVRTRKSPQTDSDTRGPRGKNRPK